MTTKERRHAQIQAASDARWHVYQRVRDGVDIDYPRTRTVAWAIECLIAAGVVVNVNRDQRRGKRAVYRLVKEMGEGEVRGLVARRENGVWGATSQVNHAAEAPTFPELPSNWTPSSAVDYLDRVARSLLRHCRRLEAMMPGVKPWDAGDLLDVTSRHPRYLSGTEDDVSDRRKRRQEAKERTALRRELRKKMEEPEPESAPGSGVDRV